MKKKICTVLFACLAALVIPATGVHAENLKGADGWAVTYHKNSRQLDSNFTSSELSEAAAGLQPGDSITFSMKLENDCDEAMQWWMQNDIIKSFEDNSVANGGAYTYRLTYTSPGGESRDLYNSDTVGGDDSDQNAGGEGLHEATNALNDSNYLFLDAISANSTAKVELEVALDGETQGNDYQDTLAKLSLRYAVETVPTQKHESTKVKYKDHKRTITKRIVKTGDNSDMIPYYIAMLAAGCVLMIAALLLMRRRDEENQVQ